MPSLFDSILSKTGAIGMRIRGYGYQAERDSVYEKVKGFNNPTRSSYTLQDRDDTFSKQPFHTPTRTKIVSFDGTLLVFDVVEDITPSFTSKITSFPVEDGAEISDHVINENPTISLTAIVSDCSAGMNPEKGLMTQAEFRDELFRIRDTRDVISLITPTATYTDLVMKKVGFPRKSGDGVSLFIDLDLEKIRKVSSERTTVFVSAKGSKDKTDKKQSGDTSTKNSKDVNGGSKPAKEIKGATGVINKSFDKNIGNE